MPAALTASGPERSADPDGLQRRWTLAFVVGELVGFVPPALAGAGLAALGAPDPVLVVGLTLAGMLEGAAIGSAQARVLARYAPGIDGRDWVLATVRAAAFAWFVGMGGGALLGASGASAWLLLLLVPAWTAALVSMGYLQWRVMRRTVAASGRWVWVTAGAWLVGVIIPVAALSSVPNGWPMWSHAIVGVAAAVIMGITVGALTGRTLERLIARPGTTGDQHGLRRHEPCALHRAWASARSHLLGELSGTPLSSIGPGWSA